MTVERRNFYRLLYVQPEAPEAVIKAAYRAMMSTLRMHPDLGGPHEAAAILNAAYETLIDPERRRAYDRSLRRPVRGASASAGPTTGTPTSDATAAQPGAATWLAERRCPACGLNFNGAPKVATRCARCDAPLFPVPEPTGSAGELLGRRCAERFARDMPGTLRLHGVGGDHAVRLRDLSVTGLSLSGALKVPKGAAFRVITGTFDAVALCVGTRATSAGFSVHGRLLTLQLVRSTRGVFVDLKALRVQPGRLRGFSPRGLAPACSQG